MRFRLHRFSDPAEAKDTPRTHACAASPSSRVATSASSATGTSSAATPRRRRKQLLQQRQHLEQGDLQSVARQVSGGLGSESGSFDKIKAMQERFILGYGGYPLIGTPEQIVDQLLELEQAGVGGMMVGFLDYVQELQIR